MSGVNRPTDGVGRFSHYLNQSRGPLPFLTVGEVLGPHGIDGTLRVRPLTDFPERFVGLKSIHVGESLRPYEIESASVGDNTVLLKLREIDSAEAALRLRGALLRVPRRDAVPLPEGEYYYDQIIGLAVVTTGGEPLGEIVDIIRTGSNDVYIVQGPRGEVLIPAIADVVKDIRLDEGQMIVELLPGLLD